MRGLFILDTKGAVFCVEATPKTVDKFLKHLIETIITNFQGNRLVAVVHKPNCFFPFRPSSNHYAVGTINHSLDVPKYFTCVLTSEDKCRSEKTDRLSDNQIEAVNSPVGSYK